MTFVVKRTGRAKSFEFRIDIDWHIYRQQLSIFIVDIVSKSVGIGTQPRLFIFVVDIEDNVSIWIAIYAKRYLVLK